MQPLTLTLATGPHDLFVSGGNTALQRVWAVIKNGVAETELFLSPGTYTVKVVEPWQDVVAVAATLMVGVEPGPPLRLDTR